ncbi:MAG TPA: DUF1648 domain-containing protein [Thermomicrobiaceae bacterium]|nr:DUF1648 domain-containing protein [Thermomicrobiaceae bacterium]
MTTGEGEDRYNRTPDDADEARPWDATDENGGYSRPSGVTAARRQPFALFQDPVSLWLLLVSVVLDVAMVVVTLVFRDRIGPAIALHWSVNGLPDRIGSPREIWVFPLISSLVVAANFVFSWLAFGYDRFLGRFLLGATWLVELTDWIALITLIR